MRRREKGGIIDWLILSRRFVRDNKTMKGLLDADSGTNMTEHPWL